jgi:DNA-binding response OmpR family regulator
VFIDGDSHSRECGARALEAHGYHVLTAQNPSEGVALVRARRPDAIVAPDETPNDNRGLRDIVSSHLPTHAQLILRCGESSPDPDTKTDVDVDLRSRITRIPRSLSVNELGWVLDRIVEKHRT